MATSEGCSGQGSRQPNYVAYLDIIYNDQEDDAEGRYSWPARFHAKNEEEVQDKVRRIVEIWTGGPSARQVSVTRVERLA